MTPELFQPVCCCGAKGDMAKFPGRNLLHLVVASGPRLCCPKRGMFVMLFWIPPTTKGPGMVGSWAPGLVVGGIFLVEVLDVSDNM